MKRLTKGTIDPLAELRAARDAACDRAEECVNALAGISDPAAFVNAAKDMRLAVDMAIIAGCSAKHFDNLKVALAAMEKAMR